MLNNIPFEMQAYPNWIVWRLEWAKDDPQHQRKPVKMPYSARHYGKASVTNPQDWITFNEARALPLNSAVPVDPETPVKYTGFTGIGFVFSHNDPFTGIDLDDTHGDAKAFADQQHIYKEFDSYSELSPSGNGLHIIIKGSIPQGRRRYFVEVYSAERFFTMTGNVFNPKPIAERQALLDDLYGRMGAKATIHTYGEDQSEKETDNEIIRKGKVASNGDKFKALYEGDWQSIYPSQSEADFALVDIIAFYTQNRKQIARIFRSSALGQRDKAKRDQYIAYMVEKSFDRQLPPIDIEGLKIEFANMMADRAGAAVQPGGSPAAPQSTAIDKPTTETDSPTYHIDADDATTFPPGLLGEVAQFILDAAPRPVPQIALAGAIALLSGVTGRAYNVNGIGLNQYIISLGRTGVGKDAIADGISKLMQAVKATVPNALDFQGPGELVSSTGLIKWLRAKPACVSIVGEIGEKLKIMSADNAPSHMKALKGFLCQMYSKSGAGKSFDPSAYADTDKNGLHLHSPAFTLIGEGVPETFYESLSEDLIQSGLIPRFMLFEYLGKRGYVRENVQFVKPSVGLIDRMATLAAQSLSLAHNGNVHDVPLTEEAAAMFKDFDRWTTDVMNDDNRRVTSELWNRAHIKSLKLAAVCAIGINYINPVITADETMWATRIVVAQTKKLFGKFERGEVGSQNGDEGRQIKDIIRVIKEYVGSPFERYAGYNISDQMHKQGVVEYAFIHKRVNPMASFRKDKAGTTNALKRTIQLLIDAGDIVEINKQQMQTQFGKGCKAYAILDPSRFV